MSSPCLHHLNHSGRTPCWCSPTPWSQTASWRVGLSAVSPRPDEVSALGKSLRSLQVLDCQVLRVRRLIRFAIPVLRNERWNLRFGPPELLERFGHELRIDRSREITRRELSFDPLLFV